MQNIGRLIEEHKALGGLIEKLLAVAGSASSDGAEAYDALRAFACQLEAHLAAEATFIYADHMRASHAPLDHAVERFEADFADLKCEWSTYLHEWTEDNICVDRDGFADATAWMMERMLARIEAENAVLYPLALQHGRISLRAH
jgi:hypothetical protein